MSVCVIKNTSGIKQNQHNAEKETHNFVLKIIKPSLPQAITSSKVKCIEPVGQAWFSHLVTWALLFLGKAMVHVMQE